MTNNYTAEYAAEMKLWSDKRKLEEQGFGQHVTKMLEVALLDFENSETGTPYDSLEKVLELLTDKLGGGIYNPNDSVVDEMSIVEFVRHYHKILASGDVGIGTMRNFHHGLSMKMYYDLRDDKFSEDELNQMIWGMQTEYSDVL